MKKILLGTVLLLVGAPSLWSQCSTCGNGVPDVGETFVNCGSDVPHAATCTSPCGQPGAYDAATGLRVSYDFVGTTTWSTAGLPVGWSFAGGPSSTTAGPLPAADAYGAKAGLIQPNCSGSCTATNGFCIGNLASTTAVGSGGSGGKLGANFDGRPNVNVNLSYAALRGQGSPTLVSPTYDMSAVEGFKVQFWVFPSETSCGQLNSWGSCVGNVAYLDFSSNGGSTWSQMIQMDLSSTNSDMCTNNSTNTLWLSEGSWSRVCLTAFRSATSPGNFYASATSGTAASGLIVNSLYFTNSFKFRIRYSQTASCTSGITTTNPGRYLAIDFPTVTSGNQLIPCGISFINMCGYGADNNDDGVGSSSATTNTFAYGTVRRSVNQAERGVEILTSQNASWGSQNLSGGTFATDYDLCNAEGGDRQCIDWQSNNNFYTVVYECVADWEAPSGTGISVQYYKNSTPASIGMTKVTNAGETALIGWRYSANRFVSCGSTSDLNPGCNGYSFRSGSLPTQFARGFYNMGTNGLGQSWSFYGASSCLHYYSGPSFAPIGLPAALPGYPNYIICQSNSLYFTGSVNYCQNNAGFGGGSPALEVTGPGGYFDIIPSGLVGTLPITVAGDYTVTATLPNTPEQCIDCGRSVCVTVTAADISNCGLVPVPGLTFWAQATGPHTVQLGWDMLHDEDARAYRVRRRLAGGDWVTLGEVPSVLDHGTYAWTDGAGYAGARDYQLEVVLPNGGTDVSRVETVTMPEDDRVRLYPQPARGRVNVQLGVDVDGFEVRLLDVAGRHVAAWQLQGSQGACDLGGIADGIYWMEVRWAGERVMRKLVVD